MAEFRNDCFGSDYVLLAFECRRNASTEAIERVGVLAAHLRAVKLLLLVSRALPRTCLMFSGLRFEVGRLPVFPHFVVAHR
jgi:hypothetical protein